MKKIFILLAASICFMPAMAQADIKTVKAEEEISEVFSFKDIYKYEQFKPGRVIFKDGTTADAQLNYNRYYEQMMFIDPKGDSLALASPELVDVIIIGKDSFYYAPGDFFVQLQNDYTPVKLASRQLLKEIDKRVTGGYGSTSNANANASYKKEYTVYGKPVELKPGEGTLFSKITELYISDAYNHFQPLNKKTLESAFGKKSKELKAYLKQYAVDFNNPVHLEKLFRYMQTI